MKASIDSIETFGLVDGPGIRTVIFFNGCKLRCKYCHNPETWTLKEKNMTVEELVNKILRNKPYFKRGGGVTFSGGEPLLHQDFLIEVCKILKKENIHIALDTAGVGNGNYQEILKYIDLVLLDVKDTTKDNYKELTGYDMDESLVFINELNKTSIPVWIRQVIVPGRNDNIDYLNSLSNFISNINNIERIDFLPYHDMAKSKYKKLGINYPYENIKSMDKEECNKLYQQFIKIYNKQN